MPESRPFKDVSITFDSHPVTNDLLVTKNEAAIKRSIINLILTKPGERFFNPNIGSRVSDLLFEPFDFVTAGLIHDEIKYTIEAFEPRVSLNTINVYMDDNLNAFDVEIVYTIVGQPATPQNLNVILERTRV
jgi:uncharacterized protein